MLQQLELCTKMGHQLICLVEWEKKIKVGSYITLKDHKESKRKWEVLAVHVLPVKQVNRNWNNNI